MNRVFRVNRVWDRMYRSGVDGLEDPEEELEEERRRHRPPAVAVQR